MAKVSMLLNLFKTCTFYLSIKHNQDEFLEKYFISSNCVNGGGFYTYNNLSDDLLVYKRHQVVNKRFNQYCTASVFTLNNPSVICQESNSTLHLSLTFVIYMASVSDLQSQISLPYWTALQSILIFVQTNHKFEVLTRASVIIPTKKPPRATQICSEFNLVENTMKVMKFKKLSSFQQLIVSKFRSQGQDTTSKPISYCYNWRLHYLVDQKLIDFNSCLRSTLASMLCHKNITNCIHLLPYSSSSTSIDLEKYFAMSHGTFISKLQFNIFFHNNHNNRHFTSIWKLFNPLSSQVWISFLISLTSVLVVMQISGTVPLLWILTTIFEQGSNGSQYVTVKTTPILTTWLISMFFLRTLYTSYMFTSLTKQLSPTNLPESFSDILNNSQICVVAQQAHWKTLKDFGHVSGAMEEDLGNPSLGPERPRVWTLDDILVAIYITWRSSVNIIINETATTTFTSIDNFVSESFPQEMLSLIYSEPNTDVPMFGFPVNSRIISLFLPSYTFVETHGQSIESSLSLWQARNTIVSKRLNFLMGYLVQAGVYLRDLQTSKTLSTLYMLKSSIAINNITNRWNLIPISQYVSGISKLEANFNYLQLESTEFANDVLISMKDLYVAYFMFGCINVAAVSMFSFEFLYSLYFKRLIVNAR